MLGSVGLAAGIVLLLLVMLAGWWKFQPVDEPFKSINVQSHKAYFAGFGSIAIYREFEIAKDTTMIVKRELVQVQNDGLMVRVELPATIVAYKRGTYKTARVIEIPQTISGKFILYSELCWQQNPIKETWIVLQPLPLEIPEQLK